jgi:hypothetical protein
MSDQEGCLKRLAALAKPFKYVGESAFLEPRGIYLPHSADCPRPPCTYFGPTIRCQVFLLFLFLFFRPHYNGNTSPPQKKCDTDASPPVAEAD